MRSPSSSAVLFRELQCLSVGGFGSRVLIGLEGSVAQGVQRCFEDERIGIVANLGGVDSRERCFNIDARSVLSASGRAGADDEPDRNRRYSGSNRVSIWTTVHGNGVSVGRFFQDATGPADFAICGWRTNDAKGDPTHPEFVRFSIAFSVV